MPFVVSVSARLPASIQTPTVEVWAHGEWSVAICSIKSDPDAQQLLDSTYCESIAKSGTLGGGSQIGGSSKSSA